MRKLWTEESVTFEGEYEKVTGVGLAPLPMQRPIPVWFGARAKVALRRAGRIADRWFPMVQPRPELTEAMAVVHGAACEAGRDPASIGIGGRVNVGAEGPDQAGERAAEWREALPPTSASTRWAPVSRPSMSTSQPWAAPRRRCTADGQESQESAYIARARRRHTPASKPIPMWVVSTSMDSASGSRQASHLTISSLRE